MAPQFNMAARSIFRILSGAQYARVSPALDKFQIGFTWEKITPIKAGIPAAED